MYSDKSIWWTAYALPKLAQVFSVKHEVGGRHYCFATKTFGIVTVCPMENWVEYKKETTLAWFRGLQRISFPGTRLPGGICETSRPDLNRKFKDAFLLWRFGSTCVTVGFLLVMRVPLGDIQQSTTFPMSDLRNSALHTDLPGHGITH